MEPRRDQLACVEQLEMRGAGNVMRVADLDDGLCARQREPEVDLQRRRAVADIDFRLAARLIRIAGHDRIGGVRGMLAVDVRPRRENARSRQVIRRDHATQLDELVVPLSRVAERGDAMTELAERELRIVLDVEVRIDQAGHDRTATEIDRLDVRGSRDPVVRTDIDDPIALNHDAAVLDRRGTTAVHDADVLEDQPSGRRLGQPRRHRRRDQNQRPPRKELAHRHRL